MVLNVGRLVLSILTSSGKASLRSLPAVSSDHLLPWSCGVVRLRRMTFRIWVKINLFFKEGDRLEIDHHIPRALGGGSGYVNLQLMHRHCHDQKTTADESLAARGTHDKSQPIEEPDDANVSRPVLKPSGGGEPPA